MISSLLLEAALRSMLLALAVWIGLRLFAVRNVLAQKAAWGLVLASALLMPVVLPMAARVPSALVIPAGALESLNAILPSRPAASPVSTATAPTQLVSQPSYIAPSIAKPHAAHKASIDPEATPQFALEENSAGSLDRYPAPAISQSPSISAQRQPSPPARSFTSFQLALFAYLAVAAVLLLRLLYGLAVAIDVWLSAKPVLLDPSALTRGLRIRTSDAISSPVTIGSAIVLPADYRDWDSEKLRIVLAHERSHIRQGDFYLQLLAGVYAALVWFSPLGWWLKRKLSDLAEAISDRAGLEEAADCTTYAQVLLQFAAAPRPTTIGVAMARTGSLSRRIERLLNDVSFKQSFSGTRRALAIVLVIPVALFAATALVRVEAAGQQTPAAPPPPTAAPTAGVPAAPAQPAQAPTEGISDPSQLLAPAAPDEPSPLASPSPETITQPQDVHVPPINVHVPGTYVHVPAINLHVPANDIHVPAVNVHIPANDIHVPPINVHMAEMNLHARDLALALAQNGQISANGSGYHYSYSNNGESYAILRGNDKEHISFSGDWMEGRREELEKARKAAGGKDILWFTRNGKSYFVDDPATLAQIDAMYKPMEELGRQQEELGKKQEVLGKQQEDLGRQQEAVSVPTPDMSKQIAEIDEAMAKLKANQGKNMNQEQFAEIQEKIGELQGKLGEIQGQMGSRQGEFGAKMGELGEKQGELGAQQGRLGSEQGKIAQQIDRKVKSIIDQSMKDGKAHPVE
jgi:beta-lactamase regulating signal transducer with metallopeptidase domain